MPNPRKSKDWKRSIMKMRNSPLFSSRTSNALGCRWRSDAGLGEDCDVCVLRVYSLADDVSLFRI